MSLLYLLKPCIERHSGISGGG
ncbi:MAG: hypothetical protein QOC80_2154, partial [Frankiaceae bacterium]|nr:hypothetical protein [Frankiaceae bacterium]